MPRGSRFNRPINSRRRFRNAGNAPQKPPKPAKKQKLPKFKELTVAYENYITGSITNRLDALTSAISWWDTSILLYLADKPLDSDQLKTYERANKARQLGIGGSTEDEREVGLRRTLEMYHKIWGATYGLPEFSTYVDRYNAAAVDLAAKEKDLQDRYKDLTAQLNAAFSPLGMKYVIQRSETQREFDGVATISLSTELAKTLETKLRKEGILSILFSEAPTAIKASGFTHDADGNAVCNLETVAGNIAPALESMMRVCATVGRNHILRAAPETMDATQTTAASMKHRTPKHPRSASATTGATAGPKSPRSSGDKVAGRYNPGSSMAVLYGRLLDGKPHPLSDIGAGIAAADPMERLKKLAAHGKECGKWTVTIAGNTIKMEVHP